MTWKVSSGSNWPKKTAGEAPVRGHLRITPGVPPPHPFVGHWVAGHGVPGDPGLVGAPGYRPRWACHGGLPNRATTGKDT